MRTFGPGPQSTVARIDYFDAEDADPEAAVLLQTAAMRKWGVGLGEVTLSFVKR